ncbi:MAG TPA: N-acetyltransferase, partial [Bacteroidetes bacterium]|nr:N-acetyltransferase [Bacteroidota bacterium]
MGQVLEVKTKSKNPELAFRPVTKSRWRAFEQLFGTRGACGGCWCMTWRVKRTVFEKGKGPGNKRAMK